MIVSDKHSGLLGTFVSYKENEVLWIRSLIHEIGQVQLNLMFENTCHNQHKFITYEFWQNDWPLQVGINKVLYRVY
jgi:hypothetical protein